MSNGSVRFFDCCARLTQTLFPAHCVLCGVAAGAARLCAACDAALPFVSGARCAICALPVESGDICGECLAHRPAYDSVRAAYAYAFPVDRMIHAFKYRGDLALASVLAAALARAGTPEVDVLVPLPISSARLQARGFNQAHELARIAGRRAGLSVLAHACRKVADTPPQAALPWQARARNIRGAFVCDADLAGARVAIVDDVMTTGATLNELARVMKRAGASYVSGWVIARTLRAGPLR